MEKRHNGKRDHNAKYEEEKKKKKKKDFHKFKKEEHNMIERTRNKDLQVDRYRPQSNANTQESPTKRRLRPRTKKRIESSRNSHDC